MAVTLSYAPTTFALVRVNMAAAVATKLMFTDLRVAFLAPHGVRQSVPPVSARLMPRGPKGEKRPTE